MKLKTTADQNWAEKKNLYLKYFNMEIQNY